MSDNREHSEYYIPDNFIEEGRILQGRVKIRNLIEGIILALVFAVPGIAVVLSATMTVQGKISTMIFFCVPPLAAGIAGFNGDSLFFLIRAAWQWRKDRTTMLYNPGAGLLSGDPVETLLEKTSALDQIVERYETGLSRKIENKANERLVEGRDFVFETEDTEGRYTVCESEKTGRKAAVSPKEYDETDLAGGVDLF